jgi:DedD protein
MASSAATEAIEVRRRGRRRLVGAIAIVALLVVFVPMLLDSEPRHEPASPSMQIPSPETAAPLPPPAAAPKVVPVEPNPVPVPAVPAAAAPKTASVAPPKSTPAAPAQAVTPAKTVTPAQAGAQSPAAQSPKLEGFAVQVGAYRDEKTLSEARAKLALAGVAHYTERLEGSQAGLTRLRAGPFPTREAAEKAKGTLKAASLDGQVVPLP